jgi:hypothetical protein
VSEDDLSSEPSALYIEAAEVPSGLCFWRWRNERLEQLQKLWNALRGHKPDTFNQVAIFRRHK